MYINLLTYHSHYLGGGSGFYLYEYEKDLLEILLSLQIFKMQRELDKMDIFIYWNISYCFSNYRSTNSITNNAYNYISYSLWLLKYRFY